MDEQDWEKLAAKLKIDALSEGEDSVDFSKFYRLVK